MTRNVYDETDLFYGWIPSAAHYGQPLPRYNFEGIVEEEEACYYARELERRRYRQTMVPGPDLTNTAWPLNQKPSFHLNGGEGLGPYELYSIRLAEVKQRAATRRCTCYCSFDVRAFHRLDRVAHRPGAKRKGRGDGQKGGPGVSSGPQEKEK